MKIVFMGTPDFAVGALEAIIKAGHEVIAVVTQDKLRSKELSNIKEVQSRGARVILLIKGEEPKEQEDGWYGKFHLPVMDDEFMVMPTSVVLQLIAYYVSLDRGLDVDKPRNLAKVVTVE